MPGDLMLFDVAASLLDRFSGLDQRLSKQVERLEAVRLKKESQRSPTRAKQRVVPEEYDAGVHPVRAFRMAEKGGSDFDIAAAFGIDETALMIWNKLHPELDESIERGSDAFRKRMSKVRRNPCPKCGGWLEIVIERTKESSGTEKIPRCLNCGKRFYPGVTEIIPRKRKSR